MSRLVATGIALLMLTAISMQSVAQTRVTGHVFAEIVELTGAESMSNDFVEIQANAATAEFDLGEFSFRGKANVAFDVMVTSSSLIGTNGHEASFQATPGHLEPTIDHTGNQVINIKGSAGNELFDSSDQQFAGNYQVVFAYN